MEFFRDDLAVRLDLEDRLEAAIPLRQIIERSALPDIGSTVEKIREALADATKLCHACIETGNPIRMLW